MQVPLLDLRDQYAPLRDEIMKEIAEICDSQRFILGDKVVKLEKELSEYCGVPHTCGVTSGSDALLIALMVENIGAGDEVITSPFTFFATAGAIARTGATPVFVDIDAKTYNIDPEKIEAAVTSKTRAIIPVHLFGQCCDMDKINAIARKHNLIVIEDAAQSIGAEYKGRSAGSMSDYGCFSFFPSKNLGCFGDGGAVSTNTAERFELLKIFRNHGQGSTYIHKYVGGNFRLDALQAGILSIKLRELNKWHDGRARNAAIYRELFAASGITGVTLPEVADYTTRHIYNQFSIRISGGRRDAVRKFLTENNVGCNVYYPLCLHLQDCFAYLGGKAGDCPVSEAISQEILALPIYPELKKEQLEYVVATIEKALKQA
jgi:dTDP-4-amino-4,6-dideoxygalactose transaminase